MITDLCDNVLLEIINYLSDKEAKNLAVTCKRINKIGYLKYIYMNDASDPFRFSIDFVKHNLTLNKVAIFNRMQNPQYFMPSMWPKSVIFYYSKFSDILSPNAFKTEDFKLFSLHETEDKPIRIDWVKFRNLKKIYIYCDNIDLDGIEVCEGLTDAFVYLIQNNTIKKQIGSLKKLKCLITNCNIEEGTNFISKDINFFVAKNMNGGNFKFNSTFKNIKNRNFLPYSEETIYNNYMENLI